MEVSDEITNVENRQALQIASNIIDIIDGFAGVQASNCAVGMWIWVEFF